MIRSLFILSFLMVLSLSSWSQTPLLERKISIQAKSQTIQEVLKAMEQQGGFHFSYPGGLFDPSAPISIDKKGRPVREVLIYLFPKGVKWKEKGNHIILSKSNDGNEVLVRGYIEDKNGNSVSGATVYDRGSLASTQTDQYGYYEMRIEREEAPLQLEVKKQDYRDTIVRLSSSEGIMQNVVLEPSPLDSILLSLKSAGNQTKNWLQEVGDSLFKHKSEVVNVDDTLYRDIQFSFVPYVGNHGRLSGNIINAYSLNLIGGYSMGNTALEVGGVFNINRHIVSGVQVGGVFNFCGKNVEGVQVGGVMNIHGGSFHGVQVGGVMNINGDAFSGVQVGGVMNVTRRTTEGVKVAGVMNVGMEDWEGVQVGGVANFNADDGDGVAVAGVLNFQADTLAGIQIAGVLNYATTVKGSQIGLVNVCNSMSGVPIGLFNWVSDGYHTLELNYSDQRMLEAQFRSGVRSFYTFFAAGISTQNEWTDTWSFGYGLGTSPKLSERLYLNIELSSHHISAQKFTDALSSDNRLFVGLDWQLTPWLSVFGGVQGHMYIYEKDEWYAFDYGSNDVFPYLVNSPDVASRNWVGWKAGLRFF